MKRVNIAEPSFKYDDSDPEGFRSGSFRFGSLLGAEELGTTVYELPPGESICPYHYEYAEEEWLIVLVGNRRSVIQREATGLRHGMWSALSVGPVVPIK